MEKLETGTIISQRSSSYRKNNACIVNYHVIYGTGFFTRSKFTTILVTT
jgi:hypothetical protein